MRELTDRQREILDFIKRFNMEFGHSPTYREICEEFGFSVASSAVRHVEALQQKGFVYTLKYKPRAIYLTDQSEINAKIAIGVLESIVKTLDSRRLLRHYQAVISDLNKAERSGNGDGHRYG